MSVEDQYIVPTSSERTILSTYFSENFTRVPLLRPLPTPLYTEHLSVHPYTLRTTRRKYQVGRVCFAGQRTEHLSAGFAPNDRSSVGRNTQRARETRSVATSSDNRRRKHQGKCGKIPARSSTYVGSTGARICRRMVGRAVKGDRRGNIWPR